MLDVQFEVVVIIHQTRYSLLKATIHGATYCRPVCRPTICRAVCRGP